MTPLCRLASVYMYWRARRTPRVSLEAHIALYERAALRCRAAAAYCGPDMVQSYCRDAVHNLHQAAVLRYTLDSQAQRKSEPDPNLN